MIDAFLFNDELDVLKFRLELYKGLFSKVLIFEADVTFSGKSKPCLAQENIITLEKLTQSEISVIKFDSTFVSEEDYQQRWPVENASRKQFLEFLAIQNSERVLFGDVDEFPTIEQIKWLIHAESQNLTGSYVIPMSLRYRKANWKVSKSSSHDWRSAISFSPQFPPELNQKRKYNYPEVPGIGLHLSYLDLNAFQISKKFSEFSHSEYSGFDSFERAIEKLSSKYGVDHLGRASVKNFGLFSSLPTNSLSVFEKQVLGMKPSWFDFSIFPGKLQRLAASILITEVRERDPRAIAFLSKLESTTDCELSCARAVRIVLMRASKKVKKRIEMSVLSPSRYKLHSDS